MKKILVNLVGLLTLMAVLIILVFSMPWLLMHYGINSLPNPPEPAITYGEFPFRLEYELNGQRMVIQDRLICEYAGVGSDEGRGKYREWKEKLANGEERVTLLVVDENTEIFYDPGPAYYYMGDMQERKSFIHKFPNALVMRKDGKFTTYSLIEASELLQQYNIQLIRWEYTQPIENSFTKSKT